MNSNVLFNSDSATIFIFIFYYGWGGGGWHMIINFIPLYRVCTSNWILKFFCEAFCHVAMTIFLHGSWGLVMIEWRTSWFRNRSRLKCCIKCIAVILFKTSNFQITRFVIFLCKYTIFSLFSFRKWQLGPIAITCIIDVVICI